MQSAVLAGDVQSINCKVAGMYPGTPGIELDAMSSQDRAGDAMSNRIGAGAIM